MDSNITGDLSLEATAAHFSRLFRSAFDCRIGEYVTALRLRNVENIIGMHGCCDLENIVYDCGFNSIQTFYRAFNSRYHSAPRQYFNAAEKKSSEPQKEHSTLPEESKI